MNTHVSMTPERSFFAVFCIEHLADDLGITGSDIYKMLADESDILDMYIVPHYDVLHTEGKDYIIRELKELMQKRGIIK